MASCSAVRTVANATQCGGSIRAVPALWSFSHCEEKAFVRTWLIEAAATTPGFVAGGSGRLSRKAISTVVQSSQISTAIR